MAATACPALPPDEQMTLVTPRSRSVEHMKAIPRSLKEPLGCSASTFSSTRVPTAAESGADSSSGVCEIRPGGMDTVDAQRSGAAAEVDRRMRIFSSHELLRSCTPFREAALSLGKSGAR